MSIGTKPMFRIRVEDLRGKRVKTFTVYCPPITLLRFTNLVKRVVEKLDI